MTINHIRTRLRYCGSHRFRVVYTTYIYLCVHIICTHTHIQRKLACPSSHLHGHIFCASRARRAQHDSACERNAPLTPRASLLSGHSLSGRVRGINIFGRLLTGSNNATATHTNSTPPNARAVGYTPHIPLRPRKMFNQPCAQAYYIYIHVHTYLGLVLYIFISKYLYRNQVRRRICPARNRAA